MPSCCTLVAPRGVGARVRGAEGGGRGGQTPGWAGPRSAGGSGEREPGALTPPGPRPPTPAQLRVSERPVDCRAQTGLPSAPPVLAWHGRVARLPPPSGCQRPLVPWVGSGALRRRAAWAEAPAEGQAKRQAARRPRRPRRPGGPEARRRALGAARGTLLRLRPYHPERARSRLISEAKQGRAWLVLGWETAWEYRVL